MSAETPAPSAAEVDAQAELRLACRNLLRVRLDAATGNHRPYAQGDAWDRFALALDAAEDDAQASPAHHAAEVQAARAAALRELADDIDPTGYGWTSVKDAERFKQRLRDRADGEAKA